MHSTLSRRHFLQTSAQFAALAAATPLVLAEDRPAAPASAPLKKAIMLATVAYGTTLLEKFQAIKEAGFAGVEPNSHLDSDEILKAKTESGLEIASICCATHWKENLASPNPSERERGVEGLKQALRDAKKVGASSVLLVPCIVKEEISYGDAYQRSQEEIAKAVPLAEELGVKIAIENVWNNFLVSPLEMARYVDEFKSKFVGVHFDIGNVMRYGWPEHWIKVLGHRIVKLHFKEFSRKKMNDEGLYKGFQVQYTEGDNNWPAIMKALAAANYHDWAIVEPAYAKPAADLDGLKNVSARMDKMLAAGN